MDLRGQLAPASRAKPLNLPINASVVAHDRVRRVIAAANDAPKGRFRHRFVPSLTNIAEKCGRHLSRTGKRRVLRLQEGEFTMELVWPAKIVPPRGVETGFRKRSCSKKKLDHDPIQRIRIMV
jgi:hypothetical protein